MSRSAIAPVKAPDYVQRNIRLPKLPIMAIDTPRGQVTVDEVPGLLTLDFKRADAPSSIGILVYTLVPNVGMLVQLDAETARRTARGLLEMADTIDGEADKALPSELAAEDHRKLPVTELTLPYPRDGQSFPSLSFDEALAVGSDLSRAWVGLTGADGSAPSAEALVELVQRVWRKGAEQVAAREPEGIGL